MARDPEAEVCGLGRARAQEGDMRRLGGTVWLAGWLVVAMPSMAFAHCDALDGPVVLAAQKALQGRDVTAVLRWVPPSNEEEVRDAFNRTLQVRALGGEAQSLADRWFFETVVRIHRAGEGAPFDGLKPAGHIDPILSAADQALTAGSVDMLVAGLEDDSRRQRGRRPTVRRRLRGLPPLR